MKALKIKDLLASADLGIQVEIRGWVRTRRDSKGGFSFIELNDGSCLKNLQIIASQELENYSSTVSRLYAGCSLVVLGKLVQSQGSGQGLEVQAERIILLGDCPPEEYIIGKQRVNFETLREMPHLRTRTNTFGAVMRLRSHLALAIHQYFKNLGFLYIHTPIITANDCEGAGEQFKVEATSGPGFFGKQVYLTVSGQLEAEPYACSLGDVYTFGPTFRAENSHTTRHLSEFWMVEPEMAFADASQNQQVAEGLIRFVIQSALEQCQEDLDFFEQRIEKGLLLKLQKIASNSFKRLSYSEAIEILKSSKQNFVYPVSWGMDLQSEHEKFLTEQLGAVIVTDYPASLKPFYMKLSADGRTVGAMDILVPGVGELVGGSVREENFETLKTRMENQGIHAESLKWYLDLRRFGTVPHAGFGMGFERLVQLVSGMANIRDVIPYPRVPGKLD